MEECCICSEFYEDKHKLQCGHIFHKDCILVWIKDHKSCPLCRNYSDIIDDEYVEDLDFNIDMMAEIKLHKKSDSEPITVNCNLKNKNTAWNEITKARSELIDTVGAEGINHIDVNINGILLDRIYGEYLLIYNELIGNKKT
jgi:hypothetical protein